MRRFPFLVLAPLLLAAQQRTAEAPAAGVLASVTGTVTLTYPDGHKARAQGFDWLKPHTLIETDRAGRVLVVLVSGARYEVGERSRATLETGTIRTVAGSVRRLPGLAEIPKLAAIADSPSTARGGVVRIRGPKLRHCYPAANAAILSGPSIFSFEPIGDVTTYVIEIENDEGTVIHRAQSSGAPVTVPAGVLKPGAIYYWEVRGVVPEGEGPRCGAQFSVLPVEDETRRAALKAAVRNVGDTDSLALLGEIDRRLGLLREAREEFAAALANSGTQDHIRSALLQIDALIR